MSPTQVLRHLQNSWKDRSRGDINSKSFARIDRAMIMSVLDAYSRGGKTSQPLEKAFPGIRQAAERIYQTKEGEFRMPSELPLLMDWAQRR